ncbi:penicillin-binding protein 2, partial [Candidatus Uhrbacteria bacterium]|nr:penicillin-binding protein 2 [Candidatus Uhrbacteria bacterium]
RAAPRAVEPAIAGQSVTLTIDRDLHVAVEHALRSGLRAAGARRGAAILMDADDGALLAMVSIPTFSATALSGGVTPDDYRALVENPDHPLFPRAMSGVYPSGSTIKPFIAAAAIRTGTITAKTRIMSTGGIRVGASFFPDWRSGGHGSVSVREAIAESVNTFFYVIGGGDPESKFQIPNSKFQIRPLGPDRIAEALRVFGFGEPTGIDIAGEAKGLVPTPVWKTETRDEPWYIGDTYHLAIGQGDLLVTPLQLARATAAIANDGTLVTPHLVHDDVNRVAPILDPQYRAVLPNIRAAMRATVTEGSARVLADLPFFVSGKTGTAQTDSRHRPHAWFTGFAERDVRCQVSPVRCQTVVITVLVEEGGEGSTVAVPIARTILSAWAETGNQSPAPSS